MGLWEETWVSWLAVLLQLDEMPVFDYVLCLRRIVSDVVDTDYSWFWVLGVWCVIRVLVLRR